MKSCNLNLNLIRELWNVFNFGATILILKNYSVMIIGLRTYTRAGTPTLPDWIECLLPVTQCGQLPKSSPGSDPTRPEYFPFQSLYQPIILSNRSTSREQGRNYDPISTIQEFLHSHHFLFNFLLKEKYFPVYSQIFF